MKRVYLFCLSWSLGLIANPVGKVPVADFDALMHLGNSALLLAPQNQSFYGITGAKLLETCKQAYAQMIGNLGKPTQQYRIPKKIHQVWLGSPLPDRYKRWQAQIKELHPDWVYKLWTDKDVAEFAMENRKIYKKAANWGEKSDILRYEILYREGGVYLDIDVQCFTKLEELHRAYDFYAGFEPFWSGSETRCLTIGNAIVAACPKHPIMKRCIKNIKKFSRLYFPVSDKIQTVVKTGPMMFTLSCYEVLSKEQKGMANIIFPSKLFYPEDTSKRPEGINNYFMHYWTHSWVK